ncbi:MAG: hypothetical protein ACD_39C01664G0001 [uncultured bacterium]|nr:MAG: hypothetical protein ACD_39C01664G0001 [uncultured bacterium]
MNKNQVKKQSVAGSSIAAQEAFDKLPKLKQVYENSVEVFGEKRNLAMELSRKLDVLEADIQWEDRIQKIPVLPRDGEKYEALKARVKFASQELQQANEDMQRIHNELAELEKELKNYSFNTPASEVIELQERCKSASEKVESLRRAILAQEEIKQKASSIVPSTQELDKSREDLLAKIALGDATAKDLAAFDKEYAKDMSAAREARKSSENAVSSANQTIAGLRRRLAEAEQELNTLIDQTGSARFHFLKSEIETVCDDYLELANALTEKYKRIMALEALMRTFTDNPKIRTANYNVFKIPMFNLRAFQSFLAKAPAGFYPIAEDAGSSYALREFINAEKERIIELGIDWK